MRRVPAKGFTMNASPVNRAMQPWQYAALRSCGPETPIYAALKDQALRHLCVERTRFLRPALDRGRHSPPHPAFKRAGMYRRLQCARLLPGTLRTLS